MAEGEGSVSHFCKGSVQVVGADTFRKSILIREMSSFQR